MLIFSETTAQGQKRSGTNLLRCKEPIETAASVGGKAVVTTSARHDIF
jgi:hypothetical protein